MGGKAHTPEQIIHKLRQAEVELGQGATVPQACKKIGVTEQTYYRLSGQSSVIVTCQLS